MERYDQLYRLYEEYDAATLRAYRSFVDLFPPVDSRIALERWEDATRELEALEDEIREGFPAVGGTLADVGSMVDRDGAFVALDLATKYGRGVNVLVLDVDETLRSAGSTDNEIPRETLHLLTEFHETGVPIVVCTGQTLENVKGFLIQGLGSELVHSGDVSVVYEAGTGVFTPGHGVETKKLLYERLDEDVRAVFDHVRSRLLSAAPDEIRRGCHLQGNEFNVTLKPNFETGSSEAREVIDRALVYQLDRLGAAVADSIGADPEGAGRWARAHYGRADPEIRAVLEREGEVTEDDWMPDDARDLFERVDVAYYEADAAEIGSLELNKVVGVEAALSVLGIDDPFALVMGDSKSDLRVMEWVAENDAGISAAPEHASRDVLDHVMVRDQLAFAPGDAMRILRIVYALNRLAPLVRE